MSLPGATIATLQLRQVNLKTLARRTAGMTGATHGSNSDGHRGDSPGKCQVVGGLEHEF